MGALAGITILYTFKKYFHNKCVYLPHMSLPGPFKIRPVLARVKSVYPDRQTFEYQADSPIWIEFDKEMDSSTITNNTVIVTSSASETPVKGLLDTGSRMLMFRPNKPYPMNHEGATIKITLIGTDTGMGAITDSEGVFLDGDKDGKPGGDFEYTFHIVK
ncbi:hypothetical protein FTO70_08585 [Methanosarcina sp. KYL-1]|nr:Ig-like domain-containing protein [Methanosarcina sp. KYL-1]MCQ1535732.1 hypothetical protein [Methanosarcina sp. KYL-1]